MGKIPSMPERPSGRRKEKNDLQADRLKTAFGYLTEQEIEALLRISELRFYKENDKLFLHLNHLISERLGQDALQDICYGLSRVRGMDILRVDCTPAPHPVFYRDKSEEAFFVRNGSATISLSISEAINYIQERF